MKKFFLIIAVFIFTGISNAQNIKNEKFVYVGSYNMSGLMTQFAQITIQTKPITTSKKTFIHSSLIATTYTKWDTFFKIRDLYESYVDPVTYKPSMYKRNTLEGNYRKTEKYVFSNGKVTSTSTRMGSPEVTKTFPVGASTNDIVPAVLRLRKMDFNKIRAGQIITFVIAFDNKEFPASVKFMGKETLKNLGNLGTKECYKLSIAANTKALRGNDKNVFWMTADTNRIPVLIQFSIPVGTGQVKLTNAIVN